MAWHQIVYNNGLGHKTIWSTYIKKYTQMSTQVNKFAKF